ncbi:conserved protein of unknown function [Magnetospirillum gryphiswaldense MSR-1 v2]|uniref:Conserved hypothetical protein CHP03032 domain-containing protein n=1 Tax=Magnetospirillum gryphiswaldense (strain DSM 6361 / JCM 21280 / NBRC 15271 / MSR-1) TaxID=431944 RepID=V6EX24_MAGGM|nr:TIGR03032 family protein [Magnetospirillum gryphiswaldense]CDK97790.1 conserved protein of unknown function [Magnetospirillum gryphiswaldense MSR-1 v2]
MAASHQVLGTSPGLAAIKAQEKLPTPVLRPSPGLGGWLKDVGGSLCFTTYQSSRLFFLFAGEDGQTEAQERIVGSAMGLAIDGNKLWVSNKEQVWRFSNVGPLTIKDRQWQAVYMPRKGYFLGGCDTHDIVADTMFGNQRYELAFVNTLYSCIAAIDAHYGFRPLWKPDFITALSPEDRCHLNGMGTRDGEIAYVTLCGQSDTPIGWKAKKNGGGMVVDIRANHVLCRGLSMPHSPRWHNGRLWLLNSGDGDFGYLDGDKFVPVALCAGFARGLCFVGDYAVIGLSRLRDNTFASGMAIKDRLERLHVPQRCGLIVVDLNSGAVVHWLTIEGVVSELYDAAFLPGITRPYTPGFSEPDLHRRISHAVPGIHPFAPPRPRPDRDGEDSATSDSNGIVL